MKIYNKSIQLLRQIVAISLFTTLVILPVSLYAKNYVIISEVMYDTPLNEQIATGMAYSNGEYIELYNAGIDDINLTNWSLKGGGSTEIYTFPANTILTPKSYLVVAYQYLNSGFTLDQLFDGFATGTGKQIQYQRKIILSNSGEALKLRDPDGTTKDSLYIDGTTNKTKPYRLSAENADEISGNFCLSLQRKTATFDSNGNAITNNQEWITTTVNIYSQTATYSAPVIPGVTNISFSSEQNYIVSVSPLDETAQVDIDNGQIVLHNEARGLISIQYFDGLGRPIETVQQGITPDKSDLVSYIQYDNVGRDWKQWLPTPVTNNNGAFVEFSVFESTVKSQTLYDNDIRPFYEIKYEPSPLNRIEKQFGSGQAWVDHPVNMQYGTNDGSIAYYFVNSSNNLEKGSNYYENTLYKTQFTDEDGNKTVEYKDKLGQVVLKQSFDGVDDVNTYYVYNDLGQISYVIPPLAADDFKILSARTVINDDNDNLKKYGYLYKYDERGNCTLKRLPGCEPIYMVYDKADRLVLSQDGNQRVNNQWIVTKYDALGRVLYTGLITEATTSHQSLIADLKDEVITESWNTNNDFNDIGYTCGRFTPTMLLTVNYYDNYAFIPLIDNNLVYNANKEQEYGIKHGSAKGLLTGTITYILNGESNGGFTASTLYYDYLGRVIQTHSSNFLGGYDINYNKIDFTGNIVKSLKEHNTTNQNIISELYSYNYDHAGRLLKTTYKINDNPEVVLNDMTSNGSYDELGRLKTKKRHLVNMDLPDVEEYDYNIRSWTTRIKSGDFEEKVYYTNNPTGETCAVFNGNICFQTWTYDNLINHYSYSYDNLNRLKDAVNLNLNLDRGESFEYDKQGNISQISRYRDGELMDMLELYYNGNQLKKVTDTDGCQNLYNVKEYADLSDTEIEMTYDANGNLTKDLDRDIYAIKYNLLNLPEIIQFKNGSQIKNYYDASGLKLKTEYYTRRTNLPIPLIEGELLDFNYTPDDFVFSGSAYVSNVEYKISKVFNSNYGGFYQDKISFNMLHNDEGYVTGSVIPDINNYENGIQYCYYRRDHLGNNREVWQASYNKYSGTEPARTLQRNQFYPSGLPWVSDTNDNADAQQYKYNGKEFVEMHGYNTYDYFFRNYYPALGRMTTVDPYAENHYSVSPYTYCLNNFVNAIDPLGLDTTFVVTTPLDEVVCTPKGTSTWTSESYEYDYSGTFEMYQNQYPQFMGMSNDQANDYWRQNYSKEFFAAWQKRIDYENGLELMSKLGWAGIILTTVPLTAAIDAVNTNLQLGRLSPRTLSLPGNKAGLPPPSKSLISEGDLMRIENAATRIKKPINVVGSRANGTAGANSDWDYVIEGLNNNEWKKIKNSLPGSKSILDNTPRNIDIFKGPLNPNKPHVTINPL